MTLWLGHHAIVFRNFTLVPYCLLSPIVFLLKIYPFLCGGTPLMWELVASLGFKAPLIYHNIFTSFITHSQFTHSLCFFLGLSSCPPIFLLPYPSLFLVISNYACRYFIILSKAASLQICSITWNGFKKKLSSTNCKVNSASPFSLCEWISMQLIEA